MSRTFVDYINNPRYIVESRGFNTAAYIVKIGILFVLTTLGLSISGFQYNTWEDLKSVAYWLSVGVTILEQLWANDASYKYGLFLFSSINDDLKKANDKSDIIVYGAIDEETGLPLKNEDGSLKVVPITNTKNIRYANLAIKKINKDEKIDYVSKQIRELIDFFENKLESFKIKKRNGWLFPKRIKYGKLSGKWFFRRKTVLKYCQARINEGKELLKDHKKILVMLNKQIQGYDELVLDDLITNQDERASYNESQFYMRKRKQARSKSVLKSLIVKLIVASVGLGLLFGTIDTVDPKTIWTIVILIFVQLYNGLNEARKHVKAYEVVNAQRRAKALQLAYNMIPEIEKEEIRKAEEESKKLAAFRDELAKKYVSMLTYSGPSIKDTNTTDILPDNILPKFKKLIKNTS